jgi:twitching motility protein PilT
LIKDRNRVAEIKDYIEEGRDQYGMQSFDQHLMELVGSGDVTFETAKAAATNPADFELKLRTFGHPEANSAGNPAPAAPEADTAVESEEDEMPDGFTSGFNDLGGE